MRMFTMTINGETMREFTCYRDGKQVSFSFPYPSNDPREIDFLLRHGAKEIRVTLNAEMRRGSLPKPSFTRVHNKQPLKGGEEK